MSESTDMAMQKSFFAEEWDGNLEEDCSFSPEDVDDLTRLYPEIWQEYQEDCKGLTKGFIT